MASFIACAGMDAVGAGFKTASTGVSHVPVVSAVQGVDVIITAGTSGQDVAVSGRLFFRQIGEQRPYSSQPMVRSGREFKGKIPAEHVTGAGIEYYIALYLADGTIITSPEQDPTFLPYVIVVLPAEQEWLEVLYPEMNSVIENRMPQISAAFSSDMTITQDNLQVKLDGADITRDCEITQDFLLYVPSEELSHGNHVVTVTNLDRPEMVGSWQFSIAGVPALWQRPSGGASVTWQWAHADSDSLFLIHSPGSNFGLAAQTAGQILGRSFDVWINRSAFYKYKSTDFGFGFYGDRIRVSAGDLFPSISKLTLDGMPARGGEVDFKPFDRAAVYLVGAEGRVFTDTDTEDEFMAGLLNSRFGGFQVVIRPLMRKWEVSALYIHARNYAESEPGMPFSIEKENDICSLGTELDLPAEFAFHSEWARSSHLTRYSEESEGEAPAEPLASESHKDEGISVGLGKRIGPLALELFYLNIGDEFLSEVNPFIESGRNGFGFSGKYSHRTGFSARGEYGRYRVGATHASPVQVNTEMRANLSLSLSKLPSIFAVYYQQRVPYAKYDVRGISLGSSHRFWRLDFSVSGSRSATNFWVSDAAERHSISASANVGYEVTDGTDLRMEYSQFGSYKSGDISRIQRQSSAGVRHRIGKRHLLSMDLKTIKFADKESAENDYFENVLLFKYGYSF
jgi:hypothetical protein